MHLIKMFYLSHVSVIYFCRIKLHFKCCVYTLLLYFVNINTRVCVRVCVQR